MAVYTNFGKAVHNIRLDNGMTINEIAERVQIPPSYLSSILIGTTKLSYQMGSRIAERLKGVINNQKKYDEFYGVMLRDCKRISMIDLPKEHADKVVAMLVKLHKAEKNN